MPITSAFAMHEEVLIALSMPRGLISHYFSGGKTKIPLDIFLNLLPLKEAVGHDPDGNFKGTLKRKRGRKPHGLSTWLPYLKTRLWLDIADPLLSTAPTKRRTHRMQEVFGRSREHILKIIRRARLSGAELEIRAKIEDYVKRRDGRNCEEFLVDLLGYELSRKFI